MAEANDFASSVQGVAMRVTPLNTDGTITGAPTPRAFTTTGFMRVTFAAEYEDGDEIAEKAANGQVCISWKADDSLKRITVGLAICSPDPEVVQLLAGGDLLWNASDEMAGYASPAVGASPSKPLFIEVWSIANVDGKPAATIPYWRWAFPYTKLRYDGDREFSNGALANEFSGFGVGNDAVIVSDWLEGGLDRPFAYKRASALPAMGWSGTEPTPPS